MTIQILIVPGKPSPKGKRAGGMQMDYAEAAWNGKRLHARLFRPIVDVCRQLLEAGCPDQPWQAILPDGTKSLSGLSLSRYAKKQHTVADEQHALRKNVAQSCHNRATLAPSRNPW